VHPDLMGASGAQFDLKQREVAIAFQDAVQGDGLLSGLVPPHRIAVPDGRVLSKWQVDDVRGGFDVAVHHRDVAFAGSPLLELLTEPPMGRLVLGAHHDAARMAIQPVYDARSGLLGADLRERAPTRIPQVPGEAVDDGPGLVPPSRVHDDVRIFVQDANRNLLGREFRTGRGRQDDVHDITFAKARGSLGMSPIDGDGLLADQSLQRGPAQPRNPIAEISIETLVQITGERERHVGGAIFRVAPSGIDRAAASDRSVRIAHRFSDPPVGCSLVGCSLGVAGGVRSVG